MLGESRVLRTLLLLPTAFAVLAPPGVAQGRGRGNPHKDEDQVQPIFRQRDRQIIVVYFRTRRSGLPPGLAKRNGDLPPGLQKHLERNGTLPPGLQKRVESFPPDLERRLPRLPVIYRRGTIGPDVIILNRKTGAIVDIIRGVATVAGR